MILDSNHPGNNDPVEPWLRKIPPKDRDELRRFVADAPPLTTRQRERLRLLFRGPTTTVGGDA